MSSLTTANSLLPDETATYLNWQSLLSQLPPNIASKVGFSGDAWATGCYSLANPPLKIANKPLIPRPPIFLDRRMVGLAFPKPADPIKKPVGSTSLRSIGALGTMVETFPRAIGFLHLHDNSLQVSYPEGFDDFKGEVDATPETFGGLSVVLGVRYGLDAVSGRLRTDDGEVLPFRLSIGWEKDPEDVVVGEGFWKKEKVEPVNPRGPRKYRSGVLEKFEHYLVWRVPG
ncbi:hypothetical protein BJ508DRAFT_310623 [Ascobolus immersus RN42]|uniref:Uncharacterized protein n=1 Tax=Ascobolus immersus RN42 TaxID=1160509 RepID=A0A3N4HUQ8_ASCIM|nr:hypothetical protein BJ508DRAFT_310623 [Ascobolus immersus RN42]